MLRIALLVALLFAAVGLVLSAQEHTHMTDAEEARSAPHSQIVKEHDVTLLIVEAAEEEARSIRAGKPVHVERVRKIVDFFQNFTDQCHHAKEERYYFPVARACGGRETGELLDELINEHTRGRMDLQVIGYLLDTEPQKSSDMIAERLANYTRGLRLHIAKENKLLLPSTDPRIPHDDARAVMVAFERLEKVELGEGFHEKYHELAMELSGKQE